MELFYQQKMNTLFTWCPVISWNHLCNDYVRLHRVKKMKKKNMKNKNDIVERSLDI